MLSLLLLVVCLFVAVRRRRSGRPAIVPAVLAFVALVPVLIWLRRMVQIAQLGSGPEAHQVMLTAGISETLNTSCFELIVAVPLVAAAVVIDRRLLRRAGQP